MVIVITVIRVIIVIIAIVVMIVLIVLIVILAIIVVLVIIVIRNPDQKFQNPKAPCCLPHKIFRHPSLPRVLLLSQPGQLRCSPGPCWGGSMATIIVIIA